MAKKWRDGILTLLIVISFIYVSGYFYLKTEKYYAQYWPTSYQVNTIKVTNPDSILVQSGPSVIPINYTGLVDFRNVDPEKRKTLFIMRLLPVIVLTRERLLDQMHHVEFIQERFKNKQPITSSDSTFLKELQQRYETDSIKELIRRIYPHPVSLALAQAILESGWGTSSICRKGNNYFGIMSFSSDESRARVQFQDGDDEQYLRTYPSVLESVEHYFQVISTVSVYKKFRQKRWEGGASWQLIKLLYNYHQTDQYAAMAQSILYSNDLKKYDHLQIDSHYRQSTTLSSYLTK